MGATYGTSRGCDQRSLRKGGKNEVMAVEAMQATPLRGLLQAANVAVFVCMGRGALGSSFGW